MKRFFGLSLATIAASALLVLGMSRAIVAGTLPDISGTWYAQGDLSKRCHISQSGRSVTLVNEQSSRATGTFTDSSTLSANWSFSPIVGNISGDLRTIRWSNGTYWVRASGGGSYASGNYSSTPQYVATPKPTPTPLRMDVRVFVNTNNTSPIHIYSVLLYYLFYEEDHRGAAKWKQCIWFRNVSTKVATDVRFYGSVLDHKGAVEEELSFHDPGTFTPPVKIDEHCWQNTLWTQVKRLTREDLHVSAVTFDDGTVWKPGMEFVRAYSNTGERLAEPVTQSGGSTGESPSPAPAASGGAMLYGAIFYAPVTYAAASATDRQTAEAARADALAACNAQAGGAATCRLGVEFSTVRCGAVGVLNGKVEYGVGADERDARAMVIGKIPGAKILTIACNAR